MLDLRTPVIAAAKAVGEAAIFLFFMGGLCGLVLLAAALAE